MCRIDCWSFAMFRRLPGFPIRPCVIERIVISHDGKDKGFDVLYRNFEWGDAYSLAELRSRFEKGPVDWQARAAKERAEAATKTVEKSR